MSIKNSIKNLLGATMRVTKDNYHLLKLNNTQRLKVEKAISLELEPDSELIFNDKISYNLYAEILRWETLGLNAKKYLDKNVSHFKLKEVRLALEENIDLRYMLESDTNYTVTQIELEKYVRKYGISVDEYKPLYRDKSLVVVAKLLAQGVEKKYILLAQNEYRLTQLLKIATENKEDYESILDRGYSVHDAFIIAKYGSFKKSAINKFKKFKYEAVWGIIKVINETDSCEILELVKKVKDNEYEVIRMCDDYLNEYRREIYQHKVR